MYLELVYSLRLFTELSLQIPLLLATGKVRVLRRTVTRYIYMYRYVKYNILYSPGESSKANQNTSQPPPMQPPFSGGPPGMRPPGPGGFGGPPPGQGGFGGPPMGGFGGYGGQPGYGGGGGFGGQPPGGMGGPPPMGE